MIHAATAFNRNAIEGLIRTQHAKSKYADRVGISDRALSTVINSLIAQQNQHGPAGSFAAVAVNDGVVTGFVAGLLDRVYHIGNKLTANDVFLINEGNRIGDTLAMIDAYVTWAKQNRRVIEIMLSWSDALPGAGRVAEIYGRKGFVKVGEMFEMRVDTAVVEGIAA